MPITSWAVAAPAMTTAFASSLVEIVEAFTIVLAVATIRGWKPALIGTFAGLLVLGALVLIFGPLFNLIPIRLFHALIGAVLLWLGIKWLKKAILRAAGIIPLHDEEKIFAAEQQTLRAAAPSKDPFDKLAILTAFQAVLIEGIEVVFIVIAVGAGHGLLAAASLGAALACIAVLAIGTLVRHPLSRVPENTLKFTVGVMLVAFGLFWGGEGLGFAWPGQDLALPALVFLILMLSLLGAALLRRAKQ